MLASDSSAAPLEVAPAVLLHSLAAVAEDSEMPDISTTASCTNVHASNHGRGPCVHACLLAWFCVLLCVCVCVCLCVCACVKSIFLVASSFGAVVIVAVAVAVAAVVVMVLMMMTTWAPSDQQVVDGF